MSKNNPETNMNVIVNDIVFGDDVQILIILENDATGNVTISVDGEEIATCILKDGETNKAISGLTAGNHTVIVRYNGDAKYNQTSVVTSVDVSKAESNLTVNIEDVT